MYGTIAKLSVKPGMEKAFESYGNDQRMDIPGFKSFRVYRMDANSSEYFLVVAFESKEAYQANATSSGQQERYEKLRALLSADPEWHDGEVIASQPD